MDIKTIQLLPATKRLKQLITEYGDVWVLLRKEDSVQCFNGSSGVFIESLDGEHIRWVKPEQVEDMDWLG